MKTKFDDLIQSRIDRERAEKAEQEARRAELRAKLDKQLQELTHGVLQFLMSEVDGHFNLRVVRSEPGTRAIAATFVVKDSSPTPTTDQCYLATVGCASEHRTFRDLDEYPERQYLTARVFLEHRPTKERYFSAVETVDRFREELVKWLMEKVPRRLTGLVT